MQSFGTVGEFDKAKAATDLFLLDIQLPDGNGLRVCDALKDSPQFSHVPVVMMSANLEPIAFLSTRANGFIEKPFDLDRLLQRVASLIA